MVTTALLSTVVMGALLLVIVALVLRVRDWQQPAAGAAGSTGLLRAVNGPLGWSIAFFVIAFGVMGLGMLYASGVPVGWLDQATVGTVLLVVVAAVFTVAGTVAIYSAARTRGLNSAQAAGFSSAVLATLVLVAIVMQLFMGG